MANYTTLSIIAFGDYRDLAHFDLYPPELENPEIKITSNGTTRHIYSWFKSHATSEVLFGLVKQITNLSLLIEIEIEPGYNVLFYKGKDQEELLTLFEIPDFRDDEFFEKLNPAYLSKFKKVHLSPELLEIIQGTFIGKTYLNLLINQDCCINI